MFTVLGFRRKATAQCTRAYPSAVNLEYAAGMVPTRALLARSRYTREAGGLTTANSGRVPLKLLEDAENEERRGGNEAGSVPVKLTTSNRQSSNTASYQYQYRRRETVGGGQGRGERREEAAGDAKQNG
jgi:hypothetical protein